MNKNDLFWVFGVLGVGYWVYSQTPVGDKVKALISGWKSVEEGPTWVPILNQTEVAYSIPTDLLARIAYQESTFKDSIIRGVQASSAGALGIMQLMPQYFNSVNVPTPYTDTDVIAQINEAARQLVSLKNQLGTWELAVAGYNAGAGNVQKYGGIPPFKETQNYVAQISKDVPSILNA